MSSSTTSIKALAWAAALTVAFALDPHLDAWIRAGGRSPLRDVAHVVSLLGTASFLLSLVAIVLLRGWLMDRPGFLRVGTTALVALVLAAVCAPVLKLVFSRMRPSEFLAGQFDIFGFATTAGSFPSGHTMAAFAAAGVFLANLARGHSVRPVVLGLALAVPVARVLCGRHYLSDVIAGAAVGLLLSVLARTVIEKTRKIQGQ
jgi:membrane-associated phospholipid phosphatase